MVKPPHSGGRLALGIGEADLLGRASSDATYGAHVLGQPGQKRGLRAGPLALARAQAVYNDVQATGGREGPGPALGQFRLKI